MLSHLFGLAAAVASPVTEVLRPLTGSGRHVSARDDRAHIEVRGLHRPGTEEVARSLERHLTGLDGVHSAEVNAVLGRVAIAHDPELIGSDELVQHVEDIEREHGLDRCDPAPAGSWHPADSDGVLREVVGLAAAVGGLGYSIAGAVLPIRRLSPLVPAAFSLVETTPRVRTEVAQRLGPPATETLLRLGGTAADVLAQAPVALVTAGCQRLCGYREATARQQAWQRADRELTTRPGAHRAPPVAGVARPAPVPDGPVEHVANRSTALAAAGYAATLAATRSHDRALGILLAGVPKAATAGREAFAAQLDKDLCDGGALVLNPEALRRLDRVDTVVLDAAALRTGRHVVDEVLPVDEHNPDLPDHPDPAELVAAAHDLIDPEHPRTHRERDGWTVLPLAELAAGIPATARQAARDRAASGATVLALCHRGRPVGLAAVAAELHPLAEAVVAAARPAGSVLIAGTGSRLHRRLDADGSVAGGTRLPGAVRELQAEGHVVAVVTARGPAALAAADVGIAVDDPGGPFPWSAHAVCQDLAGACLLLAAVPVAHMTSRRSAQMSVAGSAVGAPLAALGPARGAAGRSRFPVHVAAWLAIAAGTWWGATPARLPPPVPAERTPWHAMSAQAAMTRLGSSDGGLTETESRRRVQPADVADAEPGLVRATAEELANPLTPALATGAGISASVGSIADAVMIAGVLGVNALIGGAQRLRVDRALRELGDTSASTVRVRRDGAQRVAPADELVAGDVVELHAGDVVPADCRLLEASGLEIDEAGLTGESALVIKSVDATAAQQLGDRHCMLYQSTVVAAGDAVGLVVATGERTEVGRTARLNGDAAPSSGVSERLRSLARQTLPISVGSGVALFASDMLRGHPVTSALGRAVSLAVASVPEGLPFVATVAELAAARRLSARGALARNPSTIEALGRVDVLCFDKTGTLTKGKIALRQVSDGRRARPVDDLDPPLRGIVAAAVRASPWEGRVPHQTDRAVLSGARDAGIGHDEGLEDIEQLDELVFEPSRGYHAALWRCRLGHRLSVKGAPEEVLARCSGWQRDGERVPFDAAAADEIEAEVDFLARRGYRVLAIAERTASQRPELDESRIRDLEFCGLLALADPIRPTAAESVEVLKRASVDVVMITGDHPSTAEAIAAELGVLDGRRVVTGAELDAMDDEQLAAELTKISVFARVSPAQKARIVRRLRAAGRVVAVTGDGANDAPAIRLADVGIALGKRATPAAREAADVVITDNRIETITDAIVEGRAMWTSVRDALSILLGGNLGEIAFTVGAGLLTGQAALNARQLLLVNLLTDVLPAMAVAVRPPADATPDQLLAEGPEASLGTALTREMYLRAATTAGGAAAAWMLARPVSTAGQASTTGLVALVGTQLGQTIAVRGRTPLVVAAGAGSMAALATIVTVPGVSHFFGCRPLLPHQWGVALASSAAATGAAVVWQQFR
jgi:cation-transporting ATPase I